MPDTSAWERFRFCASERLPSGRRAMVVALGAGFNVQAAGAYHGMGWADLLGEIAHRSGASAIAEQLALRPYVGSTTALWEALLSFRASRGDIPAAVAEKWLQGLVADVLGWERYPAPTAAHALRDRLDALGLADILSFNFDAWLSGPTAGVGRVRGTDSLSLRTSFGDARLWYPHGHVTRPRTIRLGIRSYGQYVEAIEAAIRLHKRSERLGAQEHTNPCAFRAARREQAPTWIDAAFHAPLAFVGMSLGPEEWPLWSFLTRRLRNAARRPDKDRPCTFILARRNARDHEHARLCATAEVLGIDMLLFDDFAEGWERFFSAFDPREKESPRLRAQIERDVVL